MNFLNSIRRKSASPSTPKRTATPSPKGRTTSQSPVTASTLTNSSSSSAARMMLHRPKIPTHGPDGKPLGKSEIRRRTLNARRARDSEMACEIPTPRLFHKQSDIHWNDEIKQAVEQFMNRYAAMGQEAIRAEFLKEVGDYRNPNTTHTWFDAYPDKNRNKDQITCMDENRVMLPSDNKKYINASWTPERDYKSDHLLTNLHRRYILTQIPLESTMEEYWQMMFEEKVATALLLLPKQDVEKMDKFWPTVLDEEKTYGCMTITCVAKSVVEGFPVRTLEVLKNKRKPAQYVWFAVCSVPALDRPHSAPIETLQALLKLTSLNDHIEGTIDEEYHGSCRVLIMDECGGTTRASLFVLIDAACDLISQNRNGKPLQIADVFKWAISCRGGAALGEEEYILAVQAVAEYIWRSTDYYKPDHYSDFANKSPEERKEIEEQYKNKYAEQYKKIVGKEPGMKWRGLREKKDN